MAHPGPEVSYFELQAYVGTTKHLGGFTSTQELIELCHIDEGTYVLDAGCGVGATACYLAKTYGCRVLGVDLRASMVARSEERAQREGVEDLATFRVADVQQLPFEDGTFHVALCESVATFCEDKQRVVDELARVTRVGGTVALNEEVWLRSPREDLVQFVEHTWAVAPGIPSPDGWARMLEHAGLADLQIQTKVFDSRREATQFSRYRLGDALRMLYRTLVLYTRNREFRTYMAGRRHVPKGLFEYLGYVVAAGRVQ